MMVIVARDEHVDEINSLFDEGWEPYKEIVVDGFELDNVYIRPHIKLILKKSETTVKSKSLSHTHGFTEY
jgi:hypothetical protein